MTCQVILTTNLLAATLKQYDSVSSLKPGLIVLLFLTTVLPSNTSDSSTTWEQKGEGNHAIFEMN